VNRNITFTALGTNLGSVAWTTSPAGSPATGTGASFTTQWGASGTKTVTASCGTSSEDATATVVKVDRIQYSDPDNGWTDVPSPLFVLKGTVVEFKAIKDPAGAPWPSGKPVWDGSGNGETKHVAFNELSVSKTDYKTVTAECGNTVPVDVVCYDLIGTLTPDDPFDQRSQTKYGIAETVDLAVIIDPGDVTASEAGDLKWRPQSGVGTLSAVTNSGTADYDAGATPGDVELKLEIQSGPSKWLGPYYDRTIVAPDGDYMKRKPGTGLRHQVDTWSCGWQGESYLLPKEVSFANIERREGECDATRTGWLSTHPPLHHDAGGYKAIGDGDRANGCKVIATDTVYSGHKSPDPDYAEGDLLWPIPAEYRVAGGAPVEFTTRNHHATSDDTGKCLMEKCTHPETRVPADPTSTY